MTYAGNYVGVDGQSYPEIAALEVQNAHVQHRSPYYGYLRSGRQNAKIYLLPKFEDVRAWFDQHVQLPDHDYLAAFSAEDLRVPIANMEHFASTTVGCVPPIGCDPQIGADGQSWPEIASRAVQNVHAQHRSPYYGYIRSGNSTPIYLLPELEVARVWFSQHVQMPDHDYIAVFSAADLRAPIAGMEHFKRTTVGCAPPIGCIPPIGDPYVGSWWPFALGLPLGGLGGYFLRRWQEQNPGRALPGVPAGMLSAPNIPPEAMTPTPNVGGPWLDMVGPDYGGGYSDGYGNPSVGSGPWLDLVGQSYGYGNPSVGCPWQDGYDAGQIYGYPSGYPAVGGWVDLVGQTDDAARRQAAATMRALIQTATREIVEMATRYPEANYWVWWLAAPTSSTYGSVTVAPGSQPEPFTSRDAAMERVRQLGQESGVIARAVFDKTSPHWPNPVTWSRSNEPEHDPMIAQYVASSQPETRAAGTYAGADTVIGAAIDDVRSRAQSIAAKHAGSVIGVIHTVADNLWHPFAFYSTRTTYAADDADDWLNEATKDQSAYTYAAYFDKAGTSWPAPYIEKIGGFRTPNRPATMSGEAWVGQQQERRWWDPRRGGVPSPGPYQSPTGPGQLPMSPFPAPW